MSLLLHAVLGGAVISAGYGGARDQATRETERAFELVVVELPLPPPSAEAVDAPPAQPAPVEPAPEALPVTAGAPTGSTAALLPPRPDERPARAEGSASMEPAAASEPSAAEEPASEAEAPSPPSPTQPVATTVPDVPEEALLHRLPATAEAVPARVLPPAPPTVRPPAPRPVARRNAPPGGGGDRAEGTALPRFGAMPEAAAAAAQEAALAPPPPATLTPAGAQAPTPRGASEPLLRAYARQLWAQIERQRPRDFSAPGVAQVAFTLLADGRLASLSLASVSGSQGLDRIALETVRAAAPFPPPPPGILADQLSFVVPFRFR